MLNTCNDNHAIVSEAMTSGSAWSGTRIASGTSRLPTPKTTAPARIVRPTPNRLASGAAIMLPASAPAPPQAKTSPTPVDDNPRSSVMYST